MAERMVSCTTVTMGRSTPARCAPPGSREHGALSSTGVVGDSYDNAMAESADGAYKTELVWRHKPFADLTELESATFRWVSWWNSKRLHQSLSYRTPEQIETEYYANQAAQAVSL